MLSSQIINPRDCHLFLIALVHHFRSRNPVKAQVLAQILQGTLRLSFLRYTDVLMFYAWVKVNLANPDSVTLLLS
jgi:hypothetical protein